MDTPYAELQQSDYKKQLAHLKKLATTKPYKGRPIAFSTAVLEAMHARSLKVWPQSVKAWLKSFELGGSFEQIAILREAIKDLGEFISDEAKVQRVSRYLWSEKIVRESYLAKAEKWQKPEDLEKLVAKTLNLFWVDTVLLKKKLSDDSRLLEHAKLYCYDRRDPIWPAFFKSLAVQELKDQYWQGLVFVCESKFALAINQFTRLLPELNQKPELKYLWVESLKQLLGLYRQTGNRIEVARVYSQLVEVLKDRPLQLKQYGYEDLFDWHYDRSNTRLWSARYQAMLGNYSIAENIVKATLVQLEKDLKDKSLMTDSIKERRLIELMAEAYHISSWRIALEKNDLASASLYVTKGQSLPKLNREWRLRFAWYAAWYLYLQGNNDVALTKMQELLGEVRSDQETEKLCFWIARIAQETGKAALYERYRQRLAEEFPTGFYFIYSQSRLGWSQEQTLDRKKALAAWQSWDLDVSDIFEQEDFLLNHDLAKMSLEIGNLWLAQLYLELLSSDLLKSSASDDSLMYTARLQMFAENYNEAQRLGFVLSKRSDSFWLDHPEQLYVHFPLAFVESVTQAAQTANLRPSFLLALMKQESAFQPNVSSPVGAKGLMQIMPATAARYNAETSAIVLLKRQLLEPDFNLYVAGNFLKFLTKRYDGNTIFISAAYNAGEFVVDRWLKGRGKLNELRWIENIPFSETQKYVKKVYRNQLLYESLYQKVGSSELQVLRRRHKH